MELKTMAWYYKGLLCKLKPGLAYNVLDIGAVTRVQQILLAGAGLLPSETYNKEFVEKQVDLFLSNNNINPVSTCQHYQKAVKNNRCSFIGLCPEECLYNPDNKYDEILELEEKIEELGEEIEELECQEQYE